MIYPSIDKLLNIVDSKYKLVHIAADRAKVMKEHKHYQMAEEEYVSKKEIGRALEEIDKGFIILKDNKTLYDNLIVNKSGRNISEFDIVKTAYDIVNNKDPDISSLYTTILDTFKDTVFYNKHSGLNPESTVFPLFYNLLVQALSMNDIIEIG